jgi:hypothetical protein
MHRRPIELAREAAMSRLNTHVAVRPIRAIGRIYVIAVPSEWFLRRLEQEIFPATAIVRHFV